MSGDGVVTADFINYDAQVDEIMGHGKIELKGKSFLNCYSELNSVRSSVSGHLQQTRSMTQHGPMRVGG